MDSMGEDIRTRLEEAETELCESEKKLAEGEEAIKNGEAALRQKEQEAAAEIEEAERQIEEGREQLARGKEALIAGQWQYEAGLLELKEGEEQFRNAVQKVNNSEKMLAYYQKLIIPQVENTNAIWEQIKEYRDLADSFKYLYPDIMQVQADLDAVLNPGEAYFKDIADITQPEIDALIEGKDTTEAKQEGERKRAQRTAQFYEEVTVKKVDDLILGLEQFIDYLLAHEYMEPESAQTYREYLVNIDTPEKIADLLCTYGKGIAAERGLQRGEKLLEEAKEELVEAEIKLGEGRERLKAAAGELDSGWAQYYEKTEELQEKETKLEEEKPKIRALLQEEREKLRAAIAVLEEERRTLEASKASYTAAKDAYDRSMEEARSYLNEIHPNWIIRTSPANAGFLNLVSVLSSIAGAGLVFSVLFLLISSIAYASALTLNIGNQAKQIGTTKGFGFFNSEIILKFLIFSVSAAAIGSVLSVGFAGVLSRMFLRVLEEKEIYFFSAGTPGIPFPDSLITIAGALLIGFVVTMFSCRAMITTPATYLMQGLTLKKHIARSKMSRISKKSSLYLHLIFRNMKEDIARVTVMSSIIAGSVILIGLGFVLKDGYEGMLDMQAKTIFRYDLSVSVPDSLDETEREAFLRWLSSSGCPYSAARSETLLYYDEDTNAGMILTAADETIHPFIRIADPRTKKEAALPDDGVLAPQRFAESGTVLQGEAITICDSLLAPKEAVIRGTFENYFGSYFFISKEGYRKLFGYEAKDNTYYLQLSGNDLSEVKKAIHACSDSIRLNTPDSIYDGTASISFMYTLVILLLTLIGALLAFIILTNFTNIYLVKKKKEVAVMRINGFTMHQCMRYLSQEILIIALIGLFAGTLTGILLSPLVCRLVQPVDGRFLDAFNPKAWLLACLIEAAFTVLVMVITFRQVRKFNMLEDISKQ